jgi:hypothetical protein
MRRRLGTNQSRRGNGVVGRTHCKFGVIKMKQTNMYKINQFFTSLHI